MAHLKKKEFIATALNLKNGDDVWVCVNLTREGELIGWIVGLTQGDEDQQVLITNKGTIRNFKTADSAIDFVSCNGLSNGEVSVAYC